MKPTSSRRRTSSVEADTMLESERVAVVIREAGDKGLGLQFVGNHKLLRGPEMGEVGALKTKRSALVETDRVTAHMCWVRLSAQLELPLDIQRQLLRLAGAVSLRAVRGVGESLRRQCDEQIVRRFREDIGDEAAEPLPVRLDRELHVVRIGATSPFGSQSDDSADTARMWSGRMTSMT